MFLKGLYLTNLQNSLKSTINIIKLQLNQKSLDNLNSFAKKINQSSSSRVTFIDEFGVVIAESSVDKNLLNNHLHRPEIQMANKQEFGIDMRFSKSLKEDFLYVANRFNINNQNLYIRLAISTNNLQKSFFQLWKYMIFVFLSVLIISFVLSYFINKKIQTQIKILISMLENIANKNYNLNLNSSFSQEFVQMSNIINSIGQKLKKKDKQKRKYTAKLKLTNKQNMDIISSISHEFKNPIASIMGYSQTLLDDSLDKSIKDKFLAKIISNTQKITDMINRLSFCTKLENDDLLPLNTNFEFDLLLEEVVQNYKLNHKDRTFVLKAQKCSINADKTMIEMVLNNLLDNALKYSQNQIHVHLQDGKCSIIDFGEGILEEEMDKITKKFYHSKRLSWDNSMGLGLSIVTYLLKLHGTKLQIKSKINQGSCFSFKLPLL